ncbi:MAG: hypothetical protein ACRDPS_12990 [Nocardioides sp.]|uniref:hypothetical protein n=1 Tax=Nocardioides sp. TaxID=35761 RepID=UPI003D6A437C
MSPDGESITTDHHVPDQNQVQAVGEELRSLESLAARMGRRADALMVDVDRQIRTRSRSTRALVSVRAGLVDLAGEADVLAARAAAAAIATGGAA